MKIKFSVYNKRHRELFRSNPLFGKIISLDGQKLVISREDFLIYCLFKEQKQYHGYVTFSDFKKKLSERMSLLSDYLDLNSPSITAMFDNAQDQQIITEHVGIGTGLSVISHLHGLTEADWNIIPVNKNKDLDYRISSDGKNIIEVECKGTFEDANLKSSSVSNMRKHIEDKKVSQRKNDNKNLLYGAITSYSAEPGELAHCRILDPVSYKNYDNPRKLRLLSRLNFYLRELNSISKAHFLIALSNKLQTLSSLSDEEIQKLNNVALVKSNGEPFEFPISFEYHKTRIPGIDGFADVRRVGSNKYLLYGFRDEIVSTIIKQNYSKITQMKFSPKTMKTEITAKLPKREVEKGTYFQDTFYGYVEQQLSGEVFQTSAGRIFGFFHYGEREDLTQNKE